MLQKLSKFLPLKFVLQRKVLGSVWCQAVCCWPGAKRLASGGWVPRGGGARSGPPCLMVSAAPVGVRTPPATGPVCSEIVAPGLSDHVLSVCWSRVEEAMDGFHFFHKRSRKCFKAGRTRGPASPPHSVSCDLPGTGLGVPGCPRRGHRCAGVRQGAFPALQSSVVDELGPHCLEVSVDTLWFTSGSAN